MKILLDVGVDVIASFKKIQALTSDRSLVLKAIQGSTLLEVNIACVE